MRGRSKERRRGQAWGTEQDIRQGRQDRIAFPSSEALKGHIKRWGNVTKGSPGELPRTIPRPVPPTHRAGQ